MRAHLEAERLWLCDWSLADLEESRPIFTDPDVMRYISGGAPRTDDQMREFIARQQKHFRERGFCLWKLLLKPHGQLIGFCGLQPLELNGTPEVEIGWRLVKEQWGNGFATEAARVALKHAVECARLTRVIAVAMPENRASLRVMEKIGMRHERATQKEGFAVAIYVRHFAVEPKRRNVLEASHKRGSDDVKLAHNWTVQRVRECLNQNQKSELIRFLRERYTERFLKAIEYLRNSPGNERGFGFAIMALCCLLIETLQCYRQGLPTSMKQDFNDLTDGLDRSKIVCGKPCPPGSDRIFRDFFQCPRHQQFFPGVDGDVFYKKIRCGLLHQAQTKGGWRIGRSGPFWDVHEKKINRDEFSDRLKECFRDFLGELEVTKTDKEPWPNVKQKLCWLIETS